MELAAFSRTKSNPIDLSQQQEQEHPQEQQQQHQQQYGKPYRWWIVLPVVLVAMTSATVDPVIMNDLTIRRYRQNLGLLSESSPSSETACTMENYTNDSNIVELSTEVQKSVSRLNIIMAGAGALPGVLTYIILGANCDRIGRRPLLLIPCIGKTIRYSLLILIVKFNLPDVWLIISIIIDGLFGSSSVLLLAAIAYISDCTTENKRSRAMVLEEAAVALTRIFPLLGVGFWLQDRGYTMLFSVSLGLNVAALIYIIIIQPESRPEANHHRILSLIHRLKNLRLAPIRGTYQVFLIKRNGHDQRDIILLTLAQIMLFIVLFGFVSIHPLYLYGKPLCFNALDLAILTSAQFSLMICVSLIISFWQKRLADSYILPLIGILFYVIHLVLFGIAKVVWFLYLTLFIGCLFFVVMAVLRSRLTKLVNENEFALVFIATGIVETMGSYVVGIVTNAIYADTIEIDPGIIFFILAGICLIPLAVIGYLLIWSQPRRQPAVIHNVELVARHSLRSTGTSELK